MVREWRSEGEVGLEAWEGGGVRGKKRDTGGGVPTRGDLSGRVWPRECAKERQGGKEQVPKLDEIASDIYKNICVCIYICI